LDAPMLLDINTAAVGGMHVTLKCFIINYLICLFHVRPMAFVKF
jgi:hypothetical protein